MKFVKNNFLEDCHSWKVCQLTVPEMSSLWSNLYFGQTNATLETLIYQTEAFTHNIWTENNIVTPFQ